MTPHCRLLRRATVGFHIVGASPALRLLPVVDGTNLKGALDRGGRTTHINYRGETSRLSRLGVQPSAQLLELVQRRPEVFDDLVRDDVGIGQVRRVCK